MFNRIISIYIPKPHVYVTLIIQSGKWLNLPSSTSNETDMRRGWGGLVPTNEFRRSNNWLPPVEKAIESQELNERHRFWNKVRPSDYSFLDQNRITAKKRSYRTSILREIEEHNELYSNRVQPCPPCMNPSHLRNIKNQNQYDPKFLEPKLQYEKSYDKYNSDSAFSQDNRFIPQLRNLAKTGPEGSLTFDKYKYISKAERDEAARIAKEATDKIALEKTQREGGLSSQNVLAPRTFTTPQNVLAPRPFDPLAPRTFTAPQNVLAPGTSRVPQNVSASVASVAPQNVSASGTSTQPEHVWVCPLLSEKDCLIPGASSGSRSRSGYSSLHLVPNSGSGSGSGYLSLHFFLFTNIKLGGTALLCSDVCIPWIFRIIGLLWIYKDLIMLAYDNMKAKYTTNSSLLYLNFRLYITGFYMLYISKYSKRICLNKFISKLMLTKNYINWKFIPDPHIWLTLTFHNSLLTVDKHLTIDKLLSISNIFNVKSNIYNLHKNEKKNEEKNEKDMKMVTNTETESKKEKWQINYAGKTKHYPAANKEWYNSIYTYNNNTVKVLPSADKIISKLIKGYFNSYSRKLDNKAKKVKSRRFRVRRVRLSTNRMLTSKAELKHTNEKVYITVYVYNNEGKHYHNTIKNIATIDRIDKFNLGAWTLKEQYQFIASKAKKYVIQGWSTYDIEKFSSKGWTLDQIRKFIPKKATPYEIYMFFSKRFREGQYLKEFPKFLSAIKKRGKMIGKREKQMATERLNRVLYLEQVIPRIYPQLVKNTSNKGLVLKSKIQNHKKSFYLLLKNKGLKPDKSLFMTKSNTHEKKYLADYVSKSLRKEINSVYFKQLMSFSKLKFEKRYVIPLIKEVKKVYNKKIEFNFVNLKYLYLNSSIFSETLLTKLKKKKNKLLRVLKNALLMFKLPTINRQAVYDEIYNKIMIIQNLGIKSLIVKPYLQNSRNSVIHNSPDGIYNPEVNSRDEHIENKFLYELTKIKDNNTDVLEKSLLNFIPEPDLSLENDRTTSELQDSVYKLCKVMDSLKHKSVSGIRIEVAGRLTKRNTAARSVFKLKYKGNIKNTDSSDKGLSTVMLRGHAKSNLQYSRLKSKRRIGSFGLKGWVSSS